MALEMTFHNLVNDKKNNTWYFAYSLGSNHTEAYITKNCAKEMIETLKLVLDENTKDKEEVYYYNEY